MIHVSNAVSSGVTEFSERNLMGGGLYVECGRWEGFARADLPNEIGYKE